MIFPLGEYTKEEVRVLARKFDLPVAEKAESQEICFLPKDNYREFLKAHCDLKIKPGKIIDSENKVIGYHKGVPFYTIGQREGLGIAVGYPLYVNKIDIRRNQVMVGAKDEALKQEFLVNNLHFTAKPIKKKIALIVKIRYNHRGAQADLFPLPDKIKVCFKKPKFAITPGQSAVFYKFDTVLGGGIIGKVLK